MRVISRFFSQLRMAALTHNPNKALLVFPVITFGLGVWQLRRLKWKEDLIATMNKELEMDPVELPTDPERVAEMEYRRVKVGGVYEHAQELHLGPRSLVMPSAISRKRAQQVSPGAGYHIVTPLVRSDGGGKILVNRGFVPYLMKDASTRPNTLVEGEVEIEGIVRLSDRSNMYAPANDIEKNDWFSRDIEEMAEATGALPIYIDAAYVPPSENGGERLPMGGQTNRTLRNEHLNYAITWFTLTFFLLVMTFRYERSTHGFFKK